MHSTAVTTSCLAAMLLSACFASRLDDGGEREAGSADASVADASVADASVADAHVADADIADADIADQHAQADSSDAANPDALRSDRWSQPDAIREDAGTPCLADHARCADDTGTCLGGICHLYGSCDQAICNTPVHFTVPDTNQRACYSNDAGMTCPAVPCNEDGTPDFCGQDAQFGWDTVHSAAERFSVVAQLVDQPVVLDHVTNLTWQGCPAGLRGANCATGDPALLDQYRAKPLCADLFWGGSRGWRLPGRHELQSIVDYGRFSPAIDDSVFPATPAANARFWSASTYADVDWQAWYVDFDFGGVDFTQKGMSCYIRCVR